MNSDILTKKLFDGGKVRMTTTRFSITIEELPRKPCQVVLRSTCINTYSAVYHSHCDDYLPENLLLAIHRTLDVLDGYDSIVTFLLGAVAQADAKPHNAPAAHGVCTSKEERHYTKVTPEGVEPLSVALADTTLYCEWTKFAVSSPGSTMSYQYDGQPHYSTVESTSEAAARKLYKLVQSPAVREALATQTRRSS